MLSFWLAGAFFLSELLVFKTISLRKAAAPLFFAGKPVSRVGCGSARFFRPC